MHEVIHYAELSVAIILLNIPFGYWRQGTKKFSFYWFLYIHLPVPVVILMRHIFHVSLSFATAPLLFGSYFFGQYIGKKIRMRRQLLQAETAPIIKK